jgi:uncharacterized protein
VLLITGGHGDNVSALFEGRDDLAVTRPATKDPTEFLEDVARFDYDVIVQYHLAQAISEQRRKNFFALMDRGVGVVTLHHAMSSFQGWAEYRTIIGGRSYLRETVENGVKMPRTTDGGAPKSPIHIADPQHPITRGLNDFVLEKEEPYKNYVVDPASRAILTTDLPASDKVIGWVHLCRKSKTAYFQPGHSKTTFQHPVYRDILLRAIRWVAGRLPQ